MRLLSLNLIVRSFSTRPVTQKLKTAAKQPLISCKRPEFNLFHLQNPHAKFNSIPLASSAWRNRKSKGDFFILHPQKSEYYAANEWGPNFSEFNVDDRLLKNLQEENLVKSTWVQSKVIPLMQKNNHVLMAAETGCGKTLAYLLPIVDSLIRSKESVGKREFNTPLALILTPGRELAEQIEVVARSLTKNLDLNVNLILGGNTKQLMVHPKFDDMDILIGTIGAISKLTTVGILRMNQCRHVVLDEADTLLDESFGGKLQHFLRRFPFHKNQLIDISPNIVGTQLALASATLPTNTDEMLQSVINPMTISRIASSNLHKLLSHVPQKFMRINKSDRPLQLLTLAKNDAAKRRPMIVFSNKSATCDFVDIFLNNNGVKCINLNGDMSMQMRLGRFKQFQDGEVSVLSTTDISSRGLNTVHVQHVVNFDFPLYAADYIHRCGRTGRVGSGENCQITNFVSSAREISLVNRIEHSARTGNELSNVDGNISGIITERINKQMEQQEQQDLLEAR